LTTTQANIATQRALFVAHLRTRGEAIKGWFARKKKVIFWSAVILVMAVVVITLLAYWYRRSPMVRATLDNLLGDAGDCLRKVLSSIRNGCVNDILEGSQP
jgi:hypothetical protein